LGAFICQWKRSGADISGATSATYALVEADIAGVITVAVTAANCDGSVTSAATSAVAKASQNAPNAPAMLERTTTSITLNTMDGCEYRMDNGAWQTDVLFEGLTPGVGYSFTARRAETNTHAASPASQAATFTTVPDETVFVAVTNITGVPATATVETPLALTGTVVPSNATNQIIVWSVVDAGATGATITGNVFEATAAGTAIITAIIADGATATTDYGKEFTITVSASDEEPTPPVITTTTLPDGKTGDEYEQTLTATGDEPITWTLEDGDLPDGLTLDETTGVISGIPTAAGTFEFTVKATNSAGEDEKELTIVIAEVPVTGVETLNVTPLQAWTRDGLLHVTGLTVGGILNVYSATGMLVYKNIATSDETDISLHAQGMYLICQGDRTVKVVFE